MRTDTPGRRPASLAWRVTAFVGLATTLVFIAFGWIVLHSLQSHFAEQDAGELGVVAASVQHILQEHPTGSDKADLPHRLANAVAGHHGVYFQVTDAAGTRLHASHGPDLTALAAASAAVPRIAADTLQIWKGDGQSYRGAVLRLDATGPESPRHYTVIVARSMDFHLRYIGKFQQALWLSTLLMCGIALLAAWLAVQQGHAPIRNISAKIRGINSAQLHLRLLPQDVPIELAELVASFNDMLGRIEDGFRQLSNFSADIAHELRTPVTNLTTQTQVALGQARGVEEYREILYSNLEEFERMSKMIGDMLFLAQTENDLHRLDLTEVDLAAEARGLFDYFEAWAEDRAVRLRLEGAAAPVRGDQLMLRRALGNLLSNAIRHTPRGGNVTVHLSSREQTTSVCVENPGTEISSAHLPRLFDRFFRVDPSRQRNGNGAGLGLAIVKSIAEAHRGEVQVRSGPSTTCFEFRLPNAG